MPRRGLKERRDTSWCLFFLNANVIEDRFIQRNATKNNGNFRSCRKTDKPSGSL